MFQRAWFAQNDDGTIRHAEDSMTDEEWAEWHANY
jgi:hypothetical protein